MKTTTLEKLIWALIYGGLLVLCLAVFVGRRDEAIGTTMAIAGGAVALAGAVLVWVRSRAKTSPTSKG